MRDTPTYVDGYAHPTTFHQNLILMSEEGGAAAPPANDPLVPAQEPVSTDPPNSLELDASEKLVEFLRDKDCFEPEERAALRAKVLKELSEIVCLFVRKVCETLNRPCEIDGKPVKAQLMPFGSYVLGVCSPSSDIDTLCLSPGFIKQGHFFKILHDLLLNHPKVKNLEKIERAFVPIMTMEFDTIDIDISFAALPGYETIPDDLDLSDDTLLNSLDKGPAIAVNGVRTNKMLLKLVPNLESFRILLRFVRIWSKERAIYGNLYGYMGGVNCALLSAFACQRYPTASPAWLIMMFFYELANWDWDRPVYINTPNTGPHEFWNEQEQEAMQVITPAYPIINSMHSATKSTRGRMVDEFNRGFKLAKKIIEKGKKGKWSLLLSPSNFFSKYSSYLEVKVSADNEQNYLKWHMAVESRIRRLALALEGIEHIEAAVTYPKCFSDPSKPFHGSMFIAVVMEKKAIEEKTKVDITPETKRFVAKLLQMQDRKAPWLVDIEPHSRRNLPLFVFPGGVRPEPKKPKAKKAAPTE